MKIFADNIEPVRLANQISLDRQFKGKHLFLEGVKDLKVYPKFLDQSNLRIIVSHGKYNMATAWKELERRNDDRKIAIRDADFIRIRDKFDPDFHDSFFITDYHDSEIMITSTDSFENVLLSHLTIEQYNKVCKDYPNLLFDLKSLIYCLGNLKLANKTHSLGLIFKPKAADGKPLDISKFVNFKSMEYLGDKKLIQTVLDYSNNKVDRDKLKSKDDIDSALKSTLVHTHNMDEIVHGHDLSQALSLFIKKTMNLNNDHLKSGNNVENCWACSFSITNLKETKLYESLEQWSRIKGFNLLK